MANSNEVTIDRTTKLKRTESTWVEIDRSSLKFVELIDYHPKYDEDYLQTLREKAQKFWLSQIDPDSWLRQIRGYDA